MKMSDLDIEKQEYIDNLYFEEFPEIVATNRIPIDKFIFTDVEDDFFELVYKGGFEENVEVVGGNGFTMLWYIPIDFNNFSIKNFAHTIKTKMTLDEDRHKITFANLVALTNNQEIKRVKDMSVVHEVPEAPVTANIILEDGKEINSIGVVGDF